MRPLHPGWSTLAKNQPRKVRLLVVATVVAVVAEAARVAVWAKAVAARAVARARVRAVAVAARVVAVAVTSWVAVAEEVAFRVV